MASTDTSQNVFYFFATYKFQGLIGTQYNARLDFTRLNFKSQKVSEYQSIRVHEYKSIREYVYKS